jgi:hypothetical protein
VLYAYIWVALARLRGQLVSVGTRSEAMLSYVTNRLRIDRQ